MSTCHNINPEYTQYYHHARNQQLLRSSKIIFLISTFAAYFIAWHISAQFNLSLWGGYSIYTLLSAFILTGLLCGAVGTKLLPEPIHAPFYAAVCAIGSGLLTLIAAPLLVKVYPAHPLQLGMLSCSLLAVMLFSIYSLAMYAMILPVIFAGLVFLPYVGVGDRVIELALLLLPILQWQLRYWFKRAVGYQFDKEQLHKDLDITGLLDPVSKLKNRKFFEQTLEMELSASIYNSVPLSLLCISLNGTTQYEYTFGKYAVSQLFERAAECLRHALYHPRDTAIHYGYNEFVIMLPETMLCDATIVVSRVLQQTDNLGLMGVGQPTDNSVHFSIRTLELLPKTPYNEAYHAINSTFAELREQELNALNIPARAGSHFVKTS